MKKSSLLILLSSLALTSCGTSYEKVDITTSIFPHFDLIRQIVKGSNLSYSMIVPPGVEVHTYRPTPKQTAQIQDSSLFFYTSDLIETWVTSMGPSKTKTINVAEELFIEDHGDDNDHQHDDHNHGVHYWTNPEIIIEEIQLLSEQLSLTYTENAVLFNTNALNYSEQILSVSNGFSNDLVSLEDPQVFFVGHNAMGDFAEHFGLKIVSLIDDIKPDADITPLQLAKLVDAIVASNTNYLFVEELADPIFARTIKDELRIKHNRTVEILELHGYHNVTLEAFKNEVTYLDLLKRNITNLKEALF